MFISLKTVLTSILIPRQTYFLHVKDISIKNDHDVSPRNQTGNNQFGDI